MTKDLIIIDNKKNVNNAKTPRRRRRRNRNKQVEKVELKALEKVNTNVLPKKQQISPTKPKFELKTKHKDFMSWVRATEDPWSAMVPCPVNFNPVPTMRSFMVRMVSTFNMAVPAGTVRMLFLYGGHAASTDVDDVSFHSAPFAATAGSLIFQPGPVSVSGITTTNSGPGLALDVPIANIANPLPATNTSSCQVLYWNTQLPFTGAGSESAHLRWKLSSTGFMIQNVTTTLNRAGVIGSARLSQAYTNAAASVNFLKTEPSFMLHGQADNVLKLPIFNQADDCGYWHGTGGSVSNACSGKPFVIFIINDSSLSQTYEIEVVQNYSLSGATVLAMTEAIIDPPLANPVAQSLTSVINNSTGIAHGATKIAQLVADGAPSADILKGAQTAKNLVGKLASFASVARMASQFAM